jgi:hypothetical protein
VLKRMLPAQLRSSIVERLRSFACVEDSNARQ